MTNLNTPPESPPRRLEADSIGLSGAVAQSAALVGPAAGAIVGTIFVAGLAGPAASLAFLIGTAICLCIAKVIGDHARFFPSAGSFYTYLTQSFGPRTGFVGGLLLFGAYLLLLPFQLAFFGTFVSSLFKSGWGWDLPWQIPAALLVALSVGLAVAGVAYSLNAGLIGLGVEVAILAIFSLTILVQGGANGLSLEPFNPTASPKGFIGGVMLACVFTIFAFVGFESATTLGEEVREPRKIIPQAVMLTTLVIGFFFLLVSYTATIGFGATTAGAAELAADPAAFNTLALEFGGPWLSILINLALISSFVALNVVTVNAGSRMLYALGRDHMLPESLSALNSRNAPGAAACWIGGTGIAATLLFGGIWGPGDYANWSAFFATFFFIAAYTLLCIGILRYKRQQRGSKRPTGREMLSDVVPVIALAGLALVLYGNVHPLPPSPLRYFIWITVVLIIAASAVAVYLGRTQPERLRRAGQLLAGEEVT
ncbi:APC family permease [Aeromicrobium sp. A1-2]|uniref:APC family permease n=1 Tax=Aeromicrobium sp. A1-2 TaxID=2107713 RepID=UPI0013C2D6A6|nr:APC family permease [Aeromicrobium sp. A1-2]